MFSYGSFSVCVLLAACLAIRSFNQSANQELDRLAFQSSTVRNGTQLEVSVDRCPFPLVHEWEIFVPSKGSYEIALQYDDLMSDRLFKRDHAAGLKKGKHIVRFERVQGQRNQVLQVSVDGAQVISLPMREDWQMGSFKGSISNTTYRSKSSIEGKARVLLEYRFFELSQSGREESENGVLLFIAPASESVQNATKK